MQEKEIIEVYLEDILPNRFQPRLNFEPSLLKELAESIKQHGVLQPLLLRKLGDKYEIIAGERRFKASQIAGLKKVPAIIMDVDDSKSAEIAIIENIQRKEMTSLEEATSFDKLLKKENLTQEQLAARMGKSQSTIANKLRLLNLDDEVQEALLKEKISERHARSLLSIKSKEEQKIMLREIINNKLTVKQTDDLIKEKYIEPKEEQKINIEVPVSSPFDVLSIQKTTTKEEPDYLTNFNEFNNLNFKPKEENLNIGNIIEDTQLYQEPFIFNDIDVNVQKDKTDVLNHSQPTIPNPYSDIEFNPQVNLMNQLNKTNLNQPEAINSFATPGLNINTDTYIKPTNIINEDLSQNNIQNITRIKETAEDIIKPDQTANLDVLLKGDEEQTSPQKNKFIFDFDEDDSDSDFLDLSTKTIDNGQNFKANSKEQIDKVKEEILKLKNSGIKIDMEEFDFENLYQIILKIEK